MALEFIRPYPVRPVDDISHYENKCINGCDINLMPLVVLPCECVYCYMCYKGNMINAGVPCQCDLDISSGPLRRLSNDSSDWDKRKFVGKLYDYQQKIIDDIDSVDRVVLSLDMGLGKTIVALVVTVECNKILIVVPVNLIIQWTLEIEKFLPNRTYCVYHGVNKSDILLDQYDIIITTARGLINDHKKDGPLWNMRLNIDCIIVDEAHVMRNPKTDIAKTMTDFIGSARNKRVLFLTGTSIVNKLTDITSLKHILHDINPPLLEWKKRSYVFLRKDDVSIHLPEIIKTDIRCDWDAMDHAPYTELKNDVRSDIINKAQMKYILPKILRLRQCCTHFDCSLNEDDYTTSGITNKVETLDEDFISSKISKLLELYDSVPVDDKMIIFCQWNRSIAIIAEAITRYTKGLEQPLLYYSKLSVSTKSKMIASFAMNPNKRVFISSIKSGGVGLNMIMANHMFIVEQSWTFADQIQAINRIHRIGQLKPVYITRLIMKNSIEEWIFRKIEEKFKISTEFDVNSTEYIPLILTDILHYFIKPDEETGATPQLVQGFYRHGKLHLVHNNQVITPYYGDDANLDADAGDDANADDDAEA